jgi:hypothetical protein
VKRTIPTAGRFRIRRRPRWLAVLWTSLLVAGMATPLHGTEPNTGHASGLEQIELVADQDATLFAEGSDLASGSGSFLFVGNIASGASRRALVRFDLRGLSPGTEILEASVQFTVDRQGPGSNTQDLGRIHRILESWGEGASDGGTGGAGTKAENGDTTWTYRSFHPPLAGEASTTWSRPGGTFVESPSASAVLTGRGQVSFGSSAELVSDINGWLMGTFPNHGWILLGNESRDQAARRIIGRSHPTSSWRPRLTLRYRSGMVVSIQRLPELVMTWKGGEGPFVVQSATDPVHGPWKDELTTHERQAPILPVSEKQFFRVMQGASSARR